MRDIRTSGLMSGDGKRGGAFAAVLAPILDSTDMFLGRVFNGVPMALRAAKVDEDAFGGSPRINNLDCVFKGAQCPYGF